jgi:hypothetical protein
MPLRADPAGDQHRAAAALQDRRHLGSVERAAEFCFLILELGTQILAEFRNQIILPVSSRQPETDGLQVAINQFR